MKTNKNSQKFAAILACLLCLTFSANAQKRKSQSKKTNAAMAAAALSSSEIKAGAEKVSTQIKNVSKFIYLLGGIAQGIEDVDKEVKTGRISRTTADQNAKNKQAVVTTITNLRAGLVALEIEFRTKPALRNYVFQIQGISEMSGTAEDEAAAGQLRNSGKTLLLVIEKLADTLAALP